MCGFRWWFAQFDPEDFWSWQWWRWEQSPQTLKPSNPFKHFKPPKFETNTEVNGNHHGLHHGPNRNIFWYQDVVLQQLPRWHLYFHWELSLGPSIQTFEALIASRTDAGQEFSWSNWPLGETWWNMVKHGETQSTLFPACFYGFWSICAYLIILMHTYANWQLMTPPIFC